ncbi:photosynthetic complex assembly protein PuhC [uncultured Limnohabitans sp.]|mgnify:FL=1|uniref:photosynthetic complex assembly protein PuhC n=1 Tax=uncultured Limnohabitans sp. TaxID=768543 RepID=UPI002615A9E5|nr:photosynthetic complex assembly protein PuhC [uncultured Limnohabitans sp.]
MNLSQSSGLTRKARTDHFPRWVLYCAAGIIAFSLISVGLIRITGNGPDQKAAAPTVQRSLVFQDHTDGGVRVEDGVTGKTLTVLQGEQGFVRGALRALTRERYSRGIGSDLPFDLIARVDGRVTLFDPSTGQRVDLESFGPTNTAEFSRFLAMRPE